MIKIIEMKYLDDNFINTSFCKNISLNEKITFSKGNIYYFGNYKEDKIELIKKKLIKNRKNLLNAIQNNVKFIISGNSFEMFNNSFKSYDLNIYTNYSKSKHSNKIRYIDDLKKGIEGNIFKYKNLICIKNTSKINKVIKKLSLA